MVYVLPRFHNISYLPLHCFDRVIQMKYAIQTVKNLVARCETVKILIIYIYVSRAKFRVLFALLSDRQPHCPHSPRDSPGLARLSGGQKSACRNCWPLLSRAEIYIYIYVVMDGQLGCTHVLYGLRFGSPKECYG